MEQGLYGKERAARMVSHTNVSVLQAVTLAPQAIKGIKSWLKKLFNRKRPILALQLRSLDGSYFLTFIHFWSEKRTSLGL